MNTLNTPEFKSEAEEAEWFDTQPDDILAMFETAAKEGTLGRGTLARRAKERGVNVAKNPSQPTATDAVEEHRQTTVAPPKRKTNIVLGGNQLARTPKTESPAQSLYLRFTEPEDLAIFDKLKAEAKSKRYPVDVYILIKLSELYPPTPAADAA